MNILLVIANPPYDGIFGGGVVMVRSLAKRLIKRGHTFHVLSEKRNKKLKDTEKIDGVNVHRYSFINIPKVRAFTNPNSLYKRAKRVVKENDIDVIIANGIWYDGYVCSKIAKESGIPMVLIVHCPLSEMSSLAGLFRNKAISAIENCTKIMTVSDFLKEDAIDNFGVNPDKIFVNRHGIRDVFIKSRFTTMEKDKIREDFKISKSYPIITCISRFGNPQKRQDILIKAGRYIKADYPDFKMIFIGPGSSSEYKKMSRKTGIHENCIFLESIPVENLIRILGVSDIFAFPTDYEGFGVVLIEAMAIGLPIIASKISPIDEIIKDGYNGKLVDNTPESFCREIIETVEDGKKRSMFSKNARKSAENFTWDKTTIILEKELKGLLQDSRT